MAMRKLCLLLALTLLATGIFSVAGAEEARGDLTERFKDKITVEHDGVGYGVRNRLTLLVLLGRADVGAGEQLGLISVIAVDDDEKLITPLQLDYRLAVQTEDGAALPIWQACAIFEQSMPPVQTPEESQKAMEALGEYIVGLLNAELPEPLLERYFVIDVEGLELIDGEPFIFEEETDVTDAVKGRLKQAKTYADEMSSKELLDEMEALSDYIHTNIKSGQLVKIADKSERYEVLRSLQAQGELRTDVNGAEMFYLDEDAWLDSLLAVFYKPVF